MPMRSWVLRFVLPLVVTALVIGSVETYIQIKFKPGFWDKTAWLLHDPFKGEPFDRIVVYTKLHTLEESNPDVISVGDSSGFFSLQPNIIMKYLPGKSYANLSTGANQAFDGYYGIAEYMLKRNPALKNIVLYMYPQLLPSDPVFDKADLAPIERRNLVGRYVGLMPPSAGLSYPVKTESFEWRIVQPGDPMLNHKVALEFDAIAAQTHGWEPEHDVRFDRINGNVPWYPDQRGVWYARLGLAERSSIVATLTAFNDMVRSYGATLIIVFAPVADTSVRHDPLIDADQFVLQAFSQAHPEIRFLTPLIETFGTEKFGMWNHISREYSNLSSKRVGLLLRDYFQHPDEPRLYKPMAEPVHPVKVTVTEPASPEAIDANEAKAAALALFEYSASGDEKFTALLSDRTRRDLAAEDSFAIMMTETRARAAMLAEKNASTSIDDSDITVEQQEVQGMRYCGAGKPIWIHLYGTMAFRYTALPKLDTVEPVQWPKASNVLIPIVRENGRLKFDGYCPEPAVDRLNG